MNKFFNYFLNITFIDILLIILFKRKARWFQLYSIINLFIVYNYLIEDTLKILNDPIKQINKLNNHDDSIFILTSHIYYIIMFKQTYYKYYIQDIIFVLGIVIPNLLFFKTNIFKIFYFCFCGIPNFIEYGLISLVINNYLNILIQKKLNIFIYNYIKYPILLFGCFINLLLYKFLFLKEIKNKNYFIDYLFLYINFLVYINGSIFNQFKLINSIK